MASLGIEYDEYTGYTIIAEPEPIEAGESFRDAIGEYVKFQNKLAEQAESAESELAALRERVKELEADAVLNYRPKSKQPKPRKRKKAKWGKRVGS